MALGAVRSAHDLPVAHQVSVYVRPPFLGSDLHQGEFRLLRGLGFHQSHQVGYPVDVGVHAYSGYAHGIGPYACGGLPSDHRQLEKLLRLVWHRPAIFGPQYVAAIDDGLGLLIGKSCGPHQLRNLPGVRFCNRIDRRESSEKPVRGLPCVIISCPLGQYRRYQYVEGIARPFRAQTFRGPSGVSPDLVLLRQRVEDPGYVFSSHFSASPAI